MNACGGKCGQRIKYEWLERLNDLSLFDLISICEGHNEGSAEHRQLPHINLRLSDVHITKIVEEWNRLKADVSSVLDECFNAASFRGHFEVRSGFASDKDGNEPVEIALLKISARFDLTKSINDPKADWFEKSIAAAELFDKKLEQIFITAVEKEKKV